MSARDDHRARTTLEDFLRANPQRTAISIDEFALDGGQRQPPGQSGRFTGARMPRESVARAVQALQKAGVLGRPWRGGFPRDRAFPRAWPVLVGATGGPV